MPIETQLTFAPYNHILTNTAVFSPDSRRIVYDIRSDPAGSVFDGTRIETVDIATRRIELLYASRNNAHCGVATYSPVENKVVFILGPEHPTPDFSYAANRRQGVLLDESNPSQPVNLDARNLTLPFTPGALRGGTHLHIFSPDGKLVCFTYQDHLIETDLRNVGVSAPIQPVVVPKTHARNHDGKYFSVLLTRTTANPRPGSDEIKRACEEAWIGTRQPYAMAFQGDVVTQSGQTITEVFIVDLPSDLTIPSDSPLEGTPTKRPAPPKGTTQRRLTFTADRKYPGIQGPRHWLRSSPDGDRIAFLMKDDAGVVQLFTISPTGTNFVQLTHNLTSIASSFNWSPDGKYIAHAMDNSICLTDTTTGTTTRLTHRSPDASAPRPEAVVFSPDGHRIAYVRPIKDLNQIFLLTLNTPPREK